MSATTFLEKKNLAYVNLFNAVLSEAPTVEDHSIRVEVVKEMKSMNPPFDAFWTVDLTLGQGYNDSTPQATIEGRMSGLLTNEVASRK